MATLHDILRTLPPDMVLKDAIKGRQKTAAEWLKDEPDLDGLEVTESKSNYGRSVSTSIYVPGVGRLWYEKLRPVAPKWGTDGK